MLATGGHLMEYYRLLGVDKYASTEDIKRAYRRLARQYHPDLNPGRNTSMHFIRIKNAYDILHDPVKRQSYDNASCYSSSPYGNPKEQEHYTRYNPDDEVIFKRKEEPAQTVENKSTPLLVFFLGEEEYALKVGDIMGISSCASITPNNDVNSIVEGMAYIRGENIPVIDLAKNFGFASTGSPEAKRIIQVIIEDVKVGFIVDSAPLMVDIPNEMIIDMPAIPTGKKVSYMQVGKIDGRIIFVLDLDQILSPLTLAVLRKQSN